MATANTAAPVKLPKLVVGVSTPDFTTGKSKDTKLTNTTTSYFNQSIKQVRQSGGDLAALDLLARTNPDVSATVSAMVRIANSGVNYRVYDDAHILSADGMTLLRSILNRLELQFDYSTGFDNRQSMAGIIETLLRGVVLTGSCAAELVLDKTRLPYAIKPNSTEKLQWVVSGTAIGITQKLIPRYTSQKGNIDLDIPTFAYSALDYNPSSAYTYSPLEPSVNASVYHSEVVENIRAVTIRSGHSRLLVTLDYEALVKSAPIDVRSDPNKLEQWLESTRQEVATQVEQLAPESAIISFSNVETSYLSSTIGAAGDYTGLVGIIDAILATSLKTPCSILGKQSGGSQNTSSVESLLFIKQCEGLQQPVVTVLNRLLTLAVRLLGFAGSVEVRFEPINLRTKSELAAFKAMEQAQILELLSYGFYEDAEAALLLGTGELGTSFKPLSGTGFFEQKAGGDVMPTNANADPATRAVSGNKSKPSPKSAGGSDNTKRK